MERPDLIPHLTPQEKVGKQLDTHLAWLKERMAKVEEKMLHSLAPDSDEKKEDSILEIKEQKQRPASPIPEMNKATGEHLEKEYVRVDGQLVLKEFADQ
jgi:predicted metal-dependent hydrolase